MSPRLTRLAARLRRACRGVAFDRELDDELAAYLEQDIDHRIAAGATPADARRAALAAFGSLDRVRDEVRRGDAAPLAASVIEDVRYAVRALRHAPLFAAAVAASLAVGMAVTMAALAFLNAWLVRPYDGVRDQARLVRIQIGDACSRPACVIDRSSAQLYAGLRDALPSLQGLAAIAPAQVAVALPEPRAMLAGFVSPNYFDILGAAPILGRVFAAADGPGVVLAHDVWRRDFGGAPAVIGRTIRVADQVVPIAGVAPEGFRGAEQRIGVEGTALWLPLSLADLVAPLDQRARQSGGRFTRFIGRVRDRADLSRVGAEATAAAAGLIVTAEDRTATAVVSPVQRLEPSFAAQAVLIVLPTPLLVLAMACVNAANLLLARGSRRRREIAIRLAIGASRGRVIRQLLIENLLLAGGAAIVALPLAWGAARAAAQVLLVPMPIDATVLMLTCITAAASAVAVGLVPALRVTAGPSAVSLGAGTSALDGTPRQTRGRRALVVAQVALSLALLASSAQLVEAVKALGGTAGTPPERLLLTSFDLDQVKIAGPRAQQFYAGLLDRVSALPGVEAAGLSRFTAVWTFGRGAGLGSIVAWVPGAAPRDAKVTLGGFAGGALFDALGLRVLHGRGFTPADRVGPPRVAVVNRIYAARALGGDALGRTIRVAARRQAYAQAIDVRIVGILDAALEPRYTRRGDPAEAIYLPSPLEPEPALTLYVRHRDGADAVAPAVRQIVRTLEPSVPILEIASLAQVNERSIGPEVWLSRTAALLGVIALLLATAGLYAVMSYLVAMRSREIAIRLALGAVPRTVLRMVLRQSLTIVAIGLGAGILLALIGSRLIQASYHGTRGLDVPAFAASLLLLVAVMLVASAIPALRAARVDPVANLKDA